MATAALAMTTSKAFAQSNNNKADNMILLTNATGGPGFETTVKHLSDGMYGIDAMIDGKIYGAAPFTMEYLANVADSPSYIGPDRCEMDAQVYGFLAEGTQARRMVSSATPLMAVPTGLKPSEHFEAGMFACSPLEQERIEIDLNY